MPEDTPHADKETGGGKPQAVRIQDLPHARSPQYVSAYSNFMQCNISPWELNLVFGLIAEVEPDKRGVIEQASILLPPQVAKAMLEVLVQKVAEYERTFGEIRPLPKRIAEANEEKGAE